MKKNRSLFIGAFLLTCFIAAGANASPLKKNDFALGIQFGYFAPYGYYEDKFEPDIGFGLFGIFYPEFDYFILDHLYFEADFHYSKLMKKEYRVNSQSSLTEMSIAAGPLFCWFLHRYFAPYIGYLGGINYLMLELDEINQESNTWKYLHVFKAGIMFTPSDSFILRLGLDYRVNELSDKYYQNMGIGISAMLKANIFASPDWQLGRKESLVQIVDIKLNSIFGARYGNYKNTGIGKITIENVGRNPLRSVKVVTDIEEITDKPTSTGMIEIIKPGEKITLDVPIAINKKILTIQEDRDLPIRFKVIYRTKRGVFSYVEHDTVLIRPKNSITWDKTAHLGSFITPRDNAVSGFARGAIALLKKEKARGIPLKIQQAAFLFDSLGAHGIAYVTDPNRSFSRRLADKKTVDYVMFPAETLNKKGGDCDDITALYASLLESVGISTAIVTIPGHVFMMFDSEVPSSSVSDVTKDAAMVFVMNGTVWIPVEITVVGKPFTEAWKNGARSVSLHRAIKEEFEVIQVAKAWVQFPPADIDEGKAVALPSEQKIFALFREDMKTIKTGSVSSLLGKYLQILKENPNDYATMNKIGILYGKYGQLDKAREYFERVIKIKGDYSAAYANIGNIFMLKKEFPKAADYFEKAVKLKPDSHIYRISLARALYETGDRKKAREEYDKVIKRHPGYKKRYAYIGGGAEDKASGLEERLKYNLWDGE